MERPTVEGVKAALRDIADRMGLIPPSREEAKHQAAQELEDSARVVLDGLGHVLDSVDDVTRHFDQVLRDVGPPPGWEPEDHGRGGYTDPPHLSGPR